MSISKRIKSRHFLIANRVITSESDVGHWILIIRPKPGMIEVFDSLGCTKQDLLPELKHFGYSLLFNETRVQALGSTSCGAFCLYTAFWRLVNIDRTFSQVLTDIYTNNFEENEETVMEFKKKYIDNE